MSDNPKGLTEEDRKTAKKSFIRKNWVLLTTIIILVAAMVVVLIMAFK